MGNDTRKVYISYAWGGESERIANELDADLQAKGITIIRDKRDLGFKGMIRDFMQEIGRGQAIVIIISDKYLKSPNCMYELIEIAKNKDFFDRIFPVVLGDADIYNPVNRIKYIKHWEDKLKELDDAMRTVSSANLQGVRDEIDSYDEIRDNVSNLTFFLKDMNTLTPDMHENTNFSSLITALEKRLAQTESASPVVSAAFTPAKPAESKTVASSASPVADFSAYLGDVINRLTRDEYKELRGERAGSVKFKKAMEMVHKGFLGSSSIFRVVVVELDHITDGSLVNLEKEVKLYGQELNKKVAGSNVYITCLVLTNEIPESVKEMIFSAARPKVGITNVNITVMVAYSAIEKDIFYPRELPSEYDSNFEENIKKYLLP